MSSKTNKKSVQANNKSSSNSNSNTNKKSLKVNDNENEESSSSSKGPYIIGGIAIIISIIAIILGLVFIYLYYNLNSQVQKLGTSTGSTGPTGPPGQNGTCPSNCNTLTGPRGDTGSIGPRGDTGSPGTSYIPSFNNISSAATSITFSPGVFFNISSGTSSDMNITVNTSSNTSSNSFCYCYNSGSKIVYFYKSGVSTTNNTSNSFFHINAGQMGIITQDTNNNINGYPVN